MEKTTKEVAAERSRQWRKDNPDKVKEQNRRGYQNDWVKSNPEKRKESYTKYNRKNHEPRKPRGKCSICDEPHIGKGYCQKHYNNFKRYGDPTHEKIEKVCVTDKCNDKCYCRGYCQYHYNRSDVVKKSRKTYERTNRVKIKKFRSRP